MNEPVNLALLRHAVANCERRRVGLNALPLDGLAEARHITDTVAELATALDTFEPGLGMRLVTALYVQVRESHLACITGTAADAASRAH
jgi:hypothetical protein